MCIPRLTYYIIWYYFSFTLFLWYLLPIRSLIISLYLRKYHGVILIISMFLYLIFFCMICVDHVLQHSKGENFHLLPNVFHEWITRPFSNIMFFNSPNRNIFMAPPDLRECMTMSKSLKRNFSYPITNTVALIFDITCSDFIYLIFTCKYWYAHFLYRPRNY